ncbi:MAG: DUF6179 domain-containing protein [Acutalibacteraceae bacterium]
MNSNELSSFSAIDQSALHSDRYFESLMTAAQQCGLLSDDDMNRISTELLTLLYDVCYGIAQKGTSSVKVETAEDISNSIMYCISVRLKKCRTADEAAKLVKESKIETLYYDGLNEISAMLNSARAKYTYLKKNRLKTENIFFNDTVGEGIKAFFAHYDSKTAAHKSVILFDYPLYNKLPPLCGAEYVCVRIEQLVYENNFCVMFDAEKIHQLLCTVQTDDLSDRNHDGKPSYIEKPINIYSYVLAASLGLILCGKDPFSLQLQGYDVGMLEHTFRKKGYEQVLAVLNEAADKLFDCMELDENTRNYAAQSVRQLSNEIVLADARNVKHLFSAEYDSPEKTPQKRSGQRMSDEAFCLLIKQIEQSEHLSEKAQLISEHVKSAEDFKDVVIRANLNFEQVQFCVKKASKRLFLLLVHKYCFMKNQDSKLISSAVHAVVDSMPEDKRKRLEEIVSSMKVQRRKR